ncbi:glycoside hydrolase family 88 protein [Paenibacillus sp. 11B]|uniref:glycoside hydrolase family 88/105 protein n=1 Tax=Paenibacillus sp. 11B TaxID=3060965 RepID=UPI00264FC191|nr:glycoside hydrolase family 88 protein [Paenibacillus sp. 11B]MDN8592384.1 glycoside hydrolase family 88 protein [Paenibacillus sp. 11B]
MYDSIPDILTTVAQRYIGDHPKHSFLFRAYHRGGFRRLGDYRYDLNLDAKWKEARTGQYVYVWGKLWSQQEATLNTGLNCYSPVTVYVNGEEIFKSELLQELFPERRTQIPISVKYGWNDVLLCFVKTEVGFGGIYGTASFKNFPLHFLTPGVDRQGQEGWLYSEPVDEPVSILPRDDMTEAETGLSWYPRRDWTEEELGAGCFNRILTGATDSTDKSDSANPSDTEQHLVAYAWSKLDVIQPGSSPVILQGTHDGALTLYIDGREVYTAAATGTFHVELPRRYGACDLVAKGETKAGNGSWGFTLNTGETSDSKGWRLRPPHPVAGCSDVWLYTGLFSLGSEPSPEDIVVTDTVFDDGAQGVYWHVDLPETSVRPYLENTHYGKWNYPLGVTLLGLLQIGQELGRDDFVQYVRDHIGLSTSFDRYGLWDREGYGAAGINNQLSAIDSLDDCGSFGSTLLAAMELGDIRGGRDTADRIADYITNEQERLEDGAFYRVRGSGEMRQETMWCDDLYMSTPFLMRYGQLTGDTSYWDDAINQFLMFRKYLYIPEQKIMSHVYDFVRGRATGIPWGRGNGWVLFSLTELLSILPSDHVKLPELLSFYRDLCQGYLALQGENGLWHQVLNRTDSYEETSCTSMFIYAYARGIREGWLGQPEAYLDAVRKGWEGMTRLSIDYKGNVYGVCRGSGYSFTALYYRDDLGWILNDTHGIGIVLLAGIEAYKMNQQLSGISLDSSVTAVQH